MHLDFFASLFILCNFLSCPHKYEKSSAAALIPANNIILFQEQLFTYERISKLFQYPLYMIAAAV